MSKLTLERIFSNPDLNGLSPTGISFSPDGNLVTYLLGSSENDQRLDLWLYDISGNRSNLLVSSADLDSGRVLSDEDKDRRERKRIDNSGIVEYQWSPSGEAILIPLGGSLHLLHLSTGRIRKVIGNEQYVTVARYSPDGKQLAYAGNQNIQVADTTSWSVRQLTFDGGDDVNMGLAEFIAQEEMHRFDGYWWSPDARFIAFTRVDRSSIKLSRRFEIDADNFRVFDQRYPYAGTPNATVKLGIVEVNSGAIQYLSLSLDDAYLARVNWLDNDYLMVQIQDREQHVLKVIKVHRNNTEQHVLIEERSDTWINLHDNFLRIKDRDFFIWSSERSGYSHLYLYNTQGRLLGQLTSGEWNVLNVKGADGTHVYFEAYTDGPLERHLYRISFDQESTQEKLTESGFYHNIFPDFSHGIYVDRYSSPNMPPATAIRHVDGKLVNMLWNNTLDENHPFFPYRRNVGSVEFGELPADDGQSLQYRLIEPARKQEGGRYPVILMVYGGPGVQRVTREWLSPWMHYMSQRGYGLIQLDNRGSSNRGKAFEAPIYRQLGDIEVQDQLQAVRYLRTLDWVDINRLVVFGHSYGGYMTLQLMFKAPDIFKAGISVAPVTDWSLYDTHYTERYLDLPDRNPAGYIASNVFDQIRNTTGKMLIIHGMADDNVLFTNSTKLFKALQDANIQFEMMTYPGAKHGLSGRLINLHRYTLMDEFLDRNLGWEPDLPSAKAEVKYNPTCTPGGSTW